MEETCRFWWYSYAGVRIGLRLLLCGAQVSTLYGSICLFNSNNFAASGAMALLSAVLLLLLLLLVSAQRVASKFTFKFQLHTFARIFHCAAKSMSSLSKHSG